MANFTVSTFIKKSLIMNIRTDILTEWTFQPIAFCTLKKCPFTRSLKGPSQHRAVVRHLHASSPHGQSAASRNAKSSEHQPQGRFDKDSGVGVSSSRDASGDGLAFVTTSAAVSTCVCDCGHRVTWPRQNSRDSDESQSALSLLPNCLSQCVRRPCTNNAYALPAALRRTGRKNDLL